MHVWRAGESDKVKAVIEPIPPCIAVEAHLVAGHMLRAFQEAIICSTLTLEPELASEQSVPCRDYPELLFTV